MSNESQEMSSKSAEVLNNAAESLEENYRQWWCRGLGLLTTAACLATLRPEARPILESLQKHYPHLCKPKTSDSENQE